MRNITIRVMLGVVLTVVTSPLVGRARAADPPPAVAEPASNAVQQARQMVADKQYAEALKLISQQLAQGKRDDKTDERYQLLMLKGESLLQTNKGSMASGAFEQAVKSAPDARSTALARANVLLIRGSPMNKYTPKVPGAQPIDILDPDARVAAYSALRDELVKTFKPKMARAMKSPTLNQSLELLPGVYDLASLDYASTGSTDATQADVKELGANARGLMQDSLRRSFHQINAMEDLSNSTEGYTRRGLFSNERKDLKEMINELRMIEKTAREVRRRANELGFPGNLWEPIASDAADQIDAAEALLEFGSPNTR